MGAFPSFPGRLAVAAALLAATTAAFAGPDAFKAEKETYEKYLERPSLWMRNRGRERFAQTGDVRALKILAKSYGRPEKPKDQVRYLLASMCADNFDSAEHLPVLREWRKKNAKSRDAWLWYRTLAVDHKLAGPDELLAVARGAKEGVLRAAAIQALAAANDPALIPLLTDLLATPPIKPFDRDLILEAAAVTLYEKRSRRKKEPYRTLAKQVIPYLDDPKVSGHTKLVLTRRLARAFGVKRLYRESAPWLALLDGKQPAEDAKAPHLMRARFLGLQATGDRICYVIDMSDSMLKPLTGKEIDDLKNPARRKPEAAKRKKKKPKPPVTGVKPGDGEPDDPPPPAPEPEDEDPDAADLAALPWEKINTRFDAARELLKISLRTLAPEQSFCVVFFGSKAELLDATPGLRHAKASNIEKVYKELDAIKPGPAKSGRPFGTLRGYTNLHGGLQRAFQVKARTVVDELEYVDPALFEHGCDTLFLLSDGKPSWDDWPEMDTLEKDDDSGDPESGGVTRQKKTGHFYGPYAKMSWICDDIRRMNLFRRMEMHCVGLGEFDPKLLAWIAGMGLGEFRQIGAK